MAPPRLQRNSGREVREIWRPKSSVPRISEPQKGKGAESSSSTLQEPASDGVEGTGDIARAKEREREVREVWANNLYDEFPLLFEVLKTAPLAAIDAEFPGFIRHTSRSAGPRELYEDVQRNVNGLNIVQLGLCFFDGSGRQCGTWQINFRDSDVSCPSYLLPKRSGADLARARTDGVESAVLSGLMVPYFRECDDGPLSASVTKRLPLWVTFSGLYDVAFFVKLVTGAPLPPTLREFSRLVRHTLGRIVDVKHLAAGFFGGFHLGLDELAESLILQPRQAGIASLRTALAFTRMAEELGGQETKIESILHAIEEKISVRRRKKHNRTVLHLLGSLYDVGSSDSRPTGVMSEPPYGT